MTGAKGRLRAREFLGRQHALEALPKVDPTVPVPASVASYPMGP